MIWADDHVTRAEMSDTLYCLQVPRDVKISRKIGIQAECLKVSTGKSNSKHDQLSLTLYRNAPHNEVSFNDGPHVRRWPHNIII